MTSRLKFPLEWALKDVDLALTAAEPNALPALAGSSGATRAAVRAGHGLEDVAAAVLALCH